MYLSSSELILDDVYDLAAWFPLFFGAVAVLLAISSLNNARLVSRLGVTRLVRRMAWTVAGCTAVFVAISFVDGGRPPFWLFCVGIALLVPFAQGIIPNCNTAAMAPLPHVAGTASALMSTVTVAGGSLLGNLVSSSFDGTVRPFAIGSGVLVAAAVALILFGATLRAARRRGRPRTRRRVARRPRPPAQLVPGAARSGRTWFRAHLVPGAPRSGRIWFRAHLVPGAPGSGRTWFRFPSTGAPGFERRGERQVPESAATTGANSCATGPWTVMYE